MQTSFDPIKSSPRVPGTIVSRREPQRRIAQAEVAACVGNLPTELAGQDALIAVLGQLLTGQQHSKPIELVPSESRPGNPDFFGQRGVPAADHPVRVDNGLDQHGTGQCLHAHAVH
jgi:hypothetical protein